MINHCNLGAIRLEVNPNPARSYVEIADFSQVYGALVIALTDNLGREVYRWRGMNISNTFFHFVSDGLLPAGIYILSGLDRNQKAT